MRAAWLVLALTASAAHADERSPTVSLGVTRAPGAEGCMTARELAQRVEARLGHATFVSAAQAELFVDARIAPAGRGWRATVAASHGNGERAGVRTLTRARGDCHALDDDLVLVVALVIDPMARPAPVIAPPPREVVYVPVPAAPPAWRFGARVATSVLGGVLPSLVPGLELAGTATPPGAWPIELGAIVTPEARAREDGHGADVRLALATLAVCPDLVARASYGVALCAGGAGGALSVEPRGLAMARGGDHATGLVFGRARGRVRVAGALFAVLDVGVTVPLARRRLSYTALDPATLDVVRHELYDIAPVGWIAALGLGVQIR